MTLAPISRTYSTKSNARRAAKKTLPANAEISIEGEPGAWRWIALEDAEVANPEPPRPIGDDAIAAAVQGWKKTVAASEGLKAYDLYVSISKLTVTSLLGVLAKIDMFNTLCEGGPWRPEDHIALERDLQSLLAAPAPFPAPQDDAEVFAAIAEFSSATAEWLSIDEDDDRHQTAAKRRDAAWDALVDAQPSTLPGILAKAWAIQKDTEGDYWDGGRVAILLNEITKVMDLPPTPEIQAGDDLDLLSVHSQIQALRRDWPKGISDDENDAWTDKLIALEDRLRAIPANTPRGLLAKLGTGWGDNFDQLEGDVGEVEKTVLAVKNDLTRWIECSDLGAVTTASNNEASDAPDSSSDGEPTPAVMAAIDRYFTYSNAYFSTPDRLRARGGRDRYVELALAVAEFPILDFGSDPFFLALQAYHATYDSDDDDVSDATYTAVFEAVPTTLAGIATKLRWWAFVDESIPGEVLETLLLALRAHDHRAPTETTNTPAPERRWSLTFSDIDALLTRLFTIDTYLTGAAGLHEFYNGGAQIKSDGVSEPDAIMALHVRAQNEMHEVRRLAQELHQNRCNQPIT